MSNKNEICYDQINKIIAQANKIKFIELLPIAVINILSIEGKNAGTSVPFMLAPLLSSLGILMYHTTIEPYPSSKQGICNYTVLIALPSTGKTTALNVIKKAMIKVEAFLDVPSNKSVLINTTSVESILHHLDKIPCMIGFYDESFFGSVDRYSDRVARYKRSFYVTLFSGFKCIDRELKSGRSKIINPRFHMCLIWHPINFINLLKQERSCYDDGLFQIFLMNAPKPPVIKAEEMRSAPATILSLHCIFYFIHMVHFEKKRNYTFSPEASQLIDFEFNLAKERVMIVNEFDSFLGAMIGKSLTQLVRLCMIIQSLNFAIETIHEFNDSNHSTDITQAFAIQCNQLIANIHPEAFIVSLEIATMARNMVDYFNLNKLVLCSYPVDPELTFNDAYQKILNDRPNFKAISVQFENYPPKVLHWMKKAMLADCSSFNASRLSQGNLKKEECDIVFHHLTDLLLGQSKIVKANNQHSVNIFTRIKSIELKQSSDLGQTIQDMGLNLKEVIKNLEEVESTEAMKLNDLSQSKAPKRPRIENEAVTDLISIQPKTKRKLNSIKTKITKINNNNGIPYVIDSDNETHLIIQSNDTDTEQDTDDNEQNIGQSNESYNNQLNKTLSDPDELTSEPEQSSHSINSSKNNNQVNQNNIFNNKKTETSQLIISSNNSIQNTDNSKSTKVIAKPPLNELTSRSRTSKMETEKVNKSTHHSKHNMRTRSKSREISPDSITTATASNSNQTETERTKNNQRTKSYSQLPTLKKKKSASNLKQNNTQSNSNSYDI